MRVLNEKNQSLSFAALGSHLGRSALGPAALAALPHVRSLASPLVRGQLAGMLDRLAGKCGEMQMKAAAAQEINFPTPVVANGFEIFFINVHKLSDTAYAHQSGRKSLPPTAPAYPVFATVLRYFTLQNSTGAGRWLWQFPRTF